jgi:hypothetical protein
MQHLKRIKMGYFEHLYQAWRYAFILVVHGLYPDIWETKVSDDILEKENETLYPYIWETKVSDDILEKENET